VTEAVRIGDEAGDHGVTVQNMLVLAAVERAAGRPAAAEATARQALDRARANRLRELERRAWEELANAQEAAGRPADALRSHRRFKAVRDSIYDAASARRIAALERQRAAEQRAHEADRLRSEARLDALEDSRRSTQRTMLLAVLAVVLGAVGYVVHRRRMDRMLVAEELSVTDALTGVRNRRYVQQTIGVDVAASLRRHRDAAARGHVAEDADIVFLLLDIDHFKQINDVHGHAAGDRVLVELAGALQAACRESDVVVRWGGEEFLVVSRFTDRAQAPVLAERVRQVVEQHATRLAGGRSLRVTCSLGWSVFPLAPHDAGGAAGWEAVVALADHALYAAKRLGRNAWVGYASGPLPLAGDVLHATPQDVAAWVAEGRLTREASTDAPAAAAPMDVPA
jgi:diguanylate cyclase (GGDEF)-like protein